MRPKGSAAELEARRRLAGRLLQEGRKIGEVAQIVAASESSVRRWHRAVKKGGVEALKAKPHRGPKPRLNAKQKRRLLKILLAGPRKAGYRTDLWTCPRVAEVIAKKFGVKYHPAHVWKLVRRLGWTCQKPEQRARERDEAAIRRWRGRDWPRIKRGQSVSERR
jgi:transposase